MCGHSFFGGSGFGWRDSELKKLQAFYYELYYSIVYVK